MKNEKRDISISIFFLKEVKKTYLKIANLHSLI